MSSVCVFCYLTKNKKMPFFLGKFSVIITFWARPIQKTRCSCAVSGGKDSVPGHFLAQEEYGSRQKACCLYLFWLDTLLHRSGSLPGGRSSAYVPSGRPLHQKIVWCTRIEAFCSKMSILLSSSAKKQVGRQPGSEVTSHVMWLAAWWLSVLPGHPNPRGVSRQDRGPLSPREMPLGRQLQGIFRARLPGTLGGSGNKLSVWRRRDPPISTENKATSKLVLIYSPQGKIKG